MSGEVLVLANDVIPGMGLPVAAPGLRAWGIAIGLRDHGYPVTIAVNEDVLPRVWSRSFPHPLPRGAIMMRAGTIGAIARTRRPKAIIATNSNFVPFLGELDETSLIYDFFAPKMLELQEQARRDNVMAALGKLRSQKLEALRRSSAVIINGRKKVPYVRDWIAQALGDANSIPTRVVNMPVPPQRSAPPTDGPIRAVVTGYLQAWSKPGAWVEALEPFLERGNFELHLLVNNHWGGTVREGLPESFRRLERFDNVVVHGLMEFDDFRRFLGTCHFSIDLFERNEERELAMVTRAAVAMASGLPVVHVPFAETSELVREQDAGWLVEADDLSEIGGIFEEISGDREVLERKREGAMRVGRLLQPRNATAPLVELLESLS